MAAERAVDSAVPAERDSPSSPGFADGGFDDFYARVRNQPVYVILGVQGSGTNLLARLLTRLFKFSVLRDRSMVFNAAARLGPAPTAAAVEREIRGFKAIVQPSLLRRKIRKEAIRDPALSGLVDVLDRASIRSGADFARLVYAYRAYSVGATRLAIKSDDLWENIHLIDQVIPDRRVIMLTRDFRDNLMSISGKLFGPVEPLCAALYVKQQLAHYATEYRRAGARGYHATFEAMLNSTRQFADDFARHFALTPQVDLEATIPALRFRPNKIGKWHKLSSRELAWCEGILRDELLEFGYPLVSASPSIPGARRLLAARVRDVVKRVPQKVSRLVERMKN